MAKTKKEINKELLEKLDFETKGDSLFKRTSTDDIKIESTQTAKEEEKKKPVKKKLTEDKPIPPRGNEGEPTKRLIYFFSRDLKLLQNYQQKLKKEHGKISLSELVRFAVNNLDIKNFHRGY